MNVCIWKEVSKLILLEIFWGRRERVLFSTSANQMSSAVVVTPAAFLKRQQWAFQTCWAAVYSQRKAVAQLKHCMGVHNQIPSQETYIGCSMLSAKCLWRREHTGGLGLRLWIAVLQFQFSTSEEMAVEVTSIDTVRALGSGRLTGWRSPCSSTSDFQYTSTAWWEDNFVSFEERKYLETQFICKN